jgi:hypothetical protein
VSVSLHAAKMAAPVPIKYTSPALEFAAYIRTARIHRMSDIRVVYEREGRVQLKKTTQHLEESRQKAQRRASGPRL